MTYVTVRGQSIGFGPLFHLGFSLSFFLCFFPHFLFSVPSADFLFFFALAFSFPPLSLSFHKLLLSAKFVHGVCPFGSGEEGLSWVGNRMPKGKETRAGSGGRRVSEDISEDLPLWDGT